MKLDKNSIVINLKTRAQLDSLIQHLIELGYDWHRPNHDDFLWEHYKDQLCIRVVQNSTNEPFHDKISYYKSVGYDILSFEEYMVRFGPPQIINLNRELIKAIQDVLNAC